MDELYAGPLVTISVIKFKLLSTFCYIKSQIIGSHFVCLFVLHEATSVRVKVSGHRRHCHGLLLTELGEILSHPPRLQPRGGLRWRLLLLGGSGRNRGGPAIPVDPSLLDSRFGLVGVG